MNKSLAEAWARSGSVADLAMPREWEYSKTIYETDTHKVVTCACGCDIPIGIPKTDKRTRLFVVGHGSEGDFSEEIKTKKEFLTIDHLNWTMY